VRVILRLLREKPESDPGRVFLAEALNALIEQEFDAEFEVVVPAPIARTQYIKLLDLSNKLKSLSIQVTIELIDGSNEDEKVILCSLVIGG
jgi:hypothetical protein